MRVSKVLKYIVLMAFCGMSFLSLYILLDFLPELEGSRGITFQLPHAFPKSAIERTTHNMDKVTSIERRSRDRYQGIFVTGKFHAGSDHTDGSKRYFIYRCDVGKMGNCSNWFDIFKGMEASYLIANLTGRIFKAEIHGFPCKLQDFMNPSNVNWSLTESFHPVLNKGMAGVGLRRMDNNYPFHNNLYKTNWTDFAQANFDYIYFKTNLDNIRGFQNSSLYRNQLSWMAGLRPDRIHSFLYQRLFTLTPRLKKRLDMYLYSILPTAQHSLLCVDLTKGGHVTDPTLELQQLTMVWSFLKTHSVTNIHKIFLLTDSHEVLSTAKRETFKERIVESPMLNIRTDDVLKQTCNRLETEIFHQHLMIECDILVVNNHGLGRMAAYLRGTDDGLYCLMGNGHIHPCTADSFKQIYQIHT